MSASVDMFLKADCNYNIYRLPLFFYSVIQFIYYTLFRFPFGARFIDSVSHLINYLR